MNIIVVNLKDNRAVVQNFYRTFKIFSWFSLGQPLGRGAFCYCQHATVESRISVSFVNSIWPWRGCWIRAPYLYRSFAYACWLWQHFTDKSKARSLDDGPNFLSYLTLNTGSFKKIWTSSTLATEVTGPDTLWFFSYGDTLKTMPTNHKLQVRIRAAVQTIEGEQVS